MEHDTLGIEGARLILLPEKVIGRTAADGSFTFFAVPAGMHTLQVNKIGFLPIALGVNVSDSVSSIAARLIPVPQRIESVVVSERRDRLPRVYERQAKHMGHVVFAEDFPQYQAFAVSDLLIRVPRFYTLLAGSKSCSKRTVYVDGLHLPPQWKLDEYVRPSEVAAIEVHRSADFIHEDFLAFEPDLPTPSQPQRLGAINLGTPPPRIAGAQGTCGRVVMIWTWWYKSRRK